MAYGRLRNEPQEAIYDRAYRLRCNEGQNRFDRTSVYAAGTAPPHAPRPLMWAGVADDSVASCKWWSGVVHAAAGLAVGAVLYRNVAGVFRGAALSVPVALAYHTATMPKPEKPVAAPA